MKSFKTMTLSLLIVMALAVSACSASAPAAEEAQSETSNAPAEEASSESSTMAEEMPAQTIVDIAVADDRFETLVTALTAADLVETLQGDGPFTVFAPTDEAFEALPEGTLDALLEDTAALSEVLLYHVVSGEVMAADVVALDEAGTVLGENVDITVEGDQVMINNSQVVITDIQASNGVIHVIDTVLLPPADETAMEDDMMNEEMPAQTIVDIAVADDRFQTLVTALSAADLVETLQSDGPFTVFAPTNEAFAALPEGTLDALLADVPALTEVLLYHVVPGEVMAADVVALNEAGTVLGENVNITVEGDQVMINESQVVITDIEASNGVIHVIDAVLLPSADETAMEDEMMEDEMAQPSIVDIAAADDRFETLVAALTAADLVETLQGDGPFTVFAPTDDAFAALPEGTLDALLADTSALSDILLYHVVSGEVMAADVVMLDSADTVLGQPVSVTVNGESVQVGGAEVVITDIDASNGVIHVIDTVLIPQS